jgi:predicted helicase
MLKKVRTAKKIGYFRREKQQLVDLLLSVINLSIQTVEIVERLPKVRFDA